MQPIKPILAVWLGYIGTDLKGEGVLDLDDRTSQWLAVLVSHHSTHITHLTSRIGRGSGEKNVPVR
jgi:hypothetical protein